MSEFFNLEKYIKTIKYHNLISFSDRVEYDLIKID